MPRIVKGAKYIFGSSVVGKDGRIAIPPEAWEEYGFKPGQKVVIMPGSLTSGGFGLASLLTLQGTPLDRAIQTYAELFQCKATEGNIITINRRIYSWVMLRQEACVQIPLGTLEAFGVFPGSRIFSVRGSGNALGFVSKGPIYEEAVRHPEIEIFITQN